MLFDFLYLLFFFFNDTATTEIYTLSLHDALPISDVSQAALVIDLMVCTAMLRSSQTLINSSKSAMYAALRRSEEHTSELQSRQYLVCRLLLEKKKIN